MGILDENMAFSFHLVSG